MTDWRRTYTCDYCGAAFSVHRSEPMEPHRLVVGRAQYSVCSPGCAERMREVHDNPELVSKATLAPRTTRALLRAKR